MGGQQHDGSLSGHPVGGLRAGAGHVRNHGLTLGPGEQQAKGVHLGNSVSDILPRGLLLGSCYNTLVNLNGPWSQGEMFISDLYFPSSIAGLYKQTVNREQRTLT